MRKLLRLFKKLIVVVGIGALALVVFPRHTQPLWEWSKSTAAEMGRDPLPSFDAGQNYAGFVVLGVALIAVVYSLWRDRSYEVLRAEYSHQTGANHLRSQVRELEGRLKELTAEREEWKGKYTAIAEKHSSALVASKEHEIRSEYGREDRQMLRKLRDQFDTLIAEKGHADGFREAMELMMVNLAEQIPSRERQPPEASQGRSRISSAQFNTDQDPRERIRAPGRHGLPDARSLESRIT